MWWCTDVCHDERTNHVMTHHETYILFRTTVTIKTLHTMVCDVTVASKIIMLPMRTCQSWRMVTFQCIPIHTMTMTIAHDHTRVLEMTCHAPLRMIVTFHFSKTCKPLWFYTVAAHGNLMRSTKDPITHSATSHTMTYRCAECTRSITCRMIVELYELLHRCAIAIILQF
jgi:hypothetical protein